ncbi:AmmeMemoRadiSam system radical SAM enzyme [Clostridia bacterium]|nr:AmmeMemoRadiSam system radical SAM enzyme [Clostridia bacterium]
MQAMFYRDDGDGSFTCQLCPHYCRLSNNEAGFCGVRGVYEGRFLSLGYGRISSGAIDPIEKKPFYHYMPQTSTLSIGFYGCNMDCPFCQNSSISKTLNDGPRTSPKEILRRAEYLEQKIVAFTYNEPLTNYEFVLQTAKLTQEAGFINALVTNGYINKEPFAQLLPYFSAVNIDIKTFRDDIYRSVLHGSLNPVLETVKLAAENCHVEICALMAPGICTTDDVTGIAKFLAGINPALPLHVNRYYPSRYFAAEATPVGILEEARDSAKNYLKHVYIGNLG